MDITWDELIDNDSRSLFVESTRINDSLSTTIFKNKGLLFVCLHKSSYKVPRDLNTEKMLSSTGSKNAKMSH